MATLKQQRLAKIRLDTLDKDLKKGELVAMGGFSKAIQKNPHKVLESKGYKEALASYGLTEKLITTALVHDIKKKPLHRVKELALGADILGMKKANEEKGGNTYNIVILDDQQRARTLRRIVVDTGTREEGSDNISDSNESEV